ncbi:MAG: glycosyl hydrolase family 28-related protein, partial [Verrucomicrobiia bacterium]
MQVRIPASLRNWKSRSITPAIIIAVLIFLALDGAAADTAGVFNVFDYGARGNGTNNDTDAIQKAIDACAAQGGGQVLLPAGTFLTGALTLHSGIDFHLANGAVLKGSANWRDYGHPGALLFAKDAINITVSGNGVIDGNDRAVWQELANEEAGGDVSKDGW